MTTDTDVAAYVQAHADRLRESGVLTSPRAERAFRAVPRHLFLPAFYLRSENGFDRVPFDPDEPDVDALETIYSGRVLITAIEEGQATSSCSESSLVANMLELLQVEEGMRVLEIGAGTGYNAALLAHMVGPSGHVTTVDNQHAVADHARQRLRRVGADQVDVVHADGFHGASEPAAFDRVVVTVGSTQLSPRWFEQLADDGVLLMPLRHLTANLLLRLAKEGDRLRGRFVGWSGFMPIRGELWDDDYGRQPLGHDDLPVEKHPLWADLRLPPDDAARHDPAWGLVSSRGGLWFHLGVVDDRAAGWSWGPQSYGLADAETGSFARIVEDRIELRGDDAILAALVSRYEEWRALGAPSLADYTARFFPGAGPGSYASGLWRHSLPSRHGTLEVTLPG